MEKVENVKQIEVKPNGRAEFSVDLKLRDPNSVINLYKVIYDAVPAKEFSRATASQAGKSNLFSLQRTGHWCRMVRRKIQNTAWRKLAVGTFLALKTLSQKMPASIRSMLKKQTSWQLTFGVRCHTGGEWWDVWKAPESTVLCLSVPSVEFTAKIEDAAAVESEDAVFQCTLSTPLNAIAWSKDNLSLESGDKYDICVSEDKLIHTLRVKDCDPADKGKYYAIAGLTSSSASLAVKGIVLDQ